MSGPVSPAERVERFMDDLRLLDPARCDLVERLRRLVLSVDPAITEQIKYGGILFSAGPPFCGIFSYTRHVSLEFSRGALLADPHHVLEGEGKLRRHIKVEEQAHLFNKNLKAYVAQALEAVRTVKPARRRGGPSP